MQRLAELEGTVRDTEIALRKERAKVRELRNDRAGQEKMDPMRLDAEEVFDYWRELIAPRAREFTGERFRAVSARLRADWTVGDLKRAIDGAKAKPMRGRTTDLLTICRNEGNLQMFLDFADLVLTRADPKLEAQYAQMKRALTEKLIARLNELRGWTADAISQLGIGFDSQEGRVVFPVRNSAGVLVGLCRYQPNAEVRNGHPKNIASGPRELFPAPETLETESIWLVEGEPDVAAMWSIGFPAVGVPGVQTWKKGWEERFSGFERVRIAFDCDEQGRSAAAARETALAPFCDTTVVLLDGDRDDGFDLTDLILETGDEAASRLAALSTATKSSGNVVRLRPPPEPLDRRLPLERVMEALERLDCRPRAAGTNQWTACCPAHDDRRPSLSIGLGDDDRVLLTCHSGCDPADVVEALSLEFRELFAS